MSQIEDIYRHLSRLLSGVGSEHSQLASEIGTDISQKFEQCETDTATILKEITKRIQCIDEVKSERSSRRSSRSNRSVSERSHVSSRISNASKLSETAARAAELKTKLKYIEAESKAKLELDKIQTRRELETAEVKLEILEGVSQGGSVLDDAKKYLPQADIMTNFLKTVSASHDQNKNSSVPNILSSSVPFTSDTNVDYAINQNQPVVAPFVSSSGLNPEVNEFVPIQRETSSFRAMDHVQTDSVHVDLPKTEMPIMSKTISSDVNLLSQIFCRPNWNRAKDATALCLNLRNALLAKRSKGTCLSVNVEDMRQAELEIVKRVQDTFFKEELLILRSFDSEGPFEANDSVKVQTIL
ncbi:unnamed protein product [Mytilus edulis]|uniref:Uncharacterized protein n=1 Tax=Mytilus edulis TaxID=6550 RepID=A0A8S3TWW9_MYTED|nr:unnamed protein product [Mytilus edulis]